MRRAALPTLTAALLGAATPALLPTPAHAASTGMVCFFQDKEAAPVPVGHVAAGHVAWAIRDPKNSNHWIWGSTENREGDSSTDPGKNNGSWIKGGTWAQMRSTLNRPTGKYRHIYDYYRCRRTSGGNLAAAQVTYRKMAANGYKVLTNNCLTKSIAIFRSYNNGLTTKYLPDGKFKAPNYYFTTTLNDTPGWAGARRY
jgi:hypothetical protein